uniref:B30.2/SPRY domain-containing protein n=1 Tax=Globodera rostochiensis TaxID=31243 RepID=A0A914I5L6_GLORO
MDGISSRASSVSFDIVGDEQIGNEDLNDVGDVSGDDVSTDREDDFAHYNVDKLAERIATAVVKKLGEKLNTVMMKPPQSNASSSANDKLLLIQPQNVWNVADCHQNLFVIQPNCLIVRSIERNIRSSVRAEMMMPRHFCGIFYFEVQVNKMFGSVGVAVGLAPKSMALDGDCVGILKNSYSYECNGSFWGHHVHGCGHWKNSPYISNDKDKHKFGAGAIVGCGVNLANRQVIYTKNGKRLDTANLFVYQTDLYPCVSLQNAGDSIVANFGPDFKYDLAKEYQ